MYHFHPALLGLQDTSLWNNGKFYLTCKPRSITNCIKLNKPIIFYTLIQLELSPDGLKFLCTDAYTIYVELYTVLDFFQFIRMSMQKKINI